MIVGLVLHGWQVDWIAELERCGLMPDRWMPFESRRGGRRRDSDRDHRWTLRSTSLAAAAVLWTVQNQNV